MYNNHRYNEYFFKIEFWKWVFSESSLKRSYILYDTNKYFSLESIMEYLFKIPSRIKFDLKKFMPIKLYLRKFQILKFDCGKQISKWSEAWASEMARGWERETARSCGRVNLWHVSSVRLLTIWLEFIASRLHINALVRLHHIATLRSPSPC